MKPDFLDIFRARVKQLGLTQTELARRVGTSQPTIANYLNGRKHPTLPVVERICRELRLRLTPHR